MSFWSSLGGALTGGLISSGTSAIGSALNYSQSKKLSAYNAQLNYDYEQKSLQNSSSSYVEGLRNAGLNPLLAAGSDGGNTSYAGGSVSTGNGTDGSGYANAVTNAKQQKINEKVADAQIRNTNADTAFKEQQAITEQAQRNAMDINNALTQVNTALAEKNLNWYDKRALTELKTMLQNANANTATAAAAQMNAQSNARNAASNALTASSQAKNAETAADQQKLNREIYENTQPEEGAVSEFLKDHPWYRKNVYGALKSLRAGTGIDGRDLINRIPRYKESYEETDTIKSGGRKVTTKKKRGRK